MKFLAIVLCLLVPAAASDPDACQRARALYDAARYPEATAAFEQLARTNPDDALVSFHLGKLAVHRRDFAGAIELLARAAARAPRDSGIALWLGNAHAWSASVADGVKDRIGHGRKALAHYRRAVELDPANVPARFALMNFYRHVPAVLGGGLNRAYEQAAEIERCDEIAGIYAHALLAFHENKYALAYDTLQRLLEKQPVHYGANFLLGRLAAASDEHRDEGMIALRRCLTRTPGENDDPHDDVRALLALLESNGAGAATRHAR